MGKRELVALPMPRVCLQFMIVAFPYHAHYFCLYFISSMSGPFRSIRLICLDKGFLSGKFVSNTFRELEVILYMI